MKRILTTALVLAALAAVLWYAFRPLPIAADLGRVTRGPLAVTLNHEGKTRVKDRYVIHAPLAGRLRRVMLDAGDRVNAGATELAVIDPLAPSLLDDRAVATAEARVRAAEAAVEQCEREQERAREQVRLARAGFERDRELQEARTLSRQELERSERELRLWEGARASAESATKVARFDLAMAEAALVRTRPSVEGDGEVAAQKLVLRAPIDGLVFRILRESEGPIAVGDPILELGDTRGLEIVADYLSTDAVRMEPGMEAWVSGWGGSTALAARLRLVEPSGFTKVSALGVEEQRVNVILDLVEAPEGLPALGDGFRVEVSVILWQAEEALRIPEASLFRHDGGWAVFRVVDDRAERVPVEVGRRNGVHAELQGGLEEGEVLVLHPSDAVEDGVKIRER